MTGSHALCVIVSEGGERKNRDIQAANHSKDVIPPWIWPDGDVAVTGLAFPNLLILGRKNGGDQKKPKFLNNRAKTL